MMTIEQIQALPKILRLAGYIKVYAEIAEVGGKLRLKHSDDNDWTEEENKEWDEISDKCDPWWYAITPEEKKLLQPIQNFLGILCCGEDPEKECILTYEEIKE